MKIKLFSLIFLNILFSLYAIEDDSTRERKKDAFYITNPVLINEYAKKIVWQGIKSGGMFLFGAYIVSPFGIELYNKYNNANHLLNGEAAQTIAHRIGAGMTLADLALGSRCSRSSSFFIGSMGIMVALQLLLH